MRIFADAQGNFCLVLTFSFTICCNWNVFPQLAMSQCNDSFVTEISKWR